MGKWWVPPTVAGMIFNPGIGVAACSLQPPYHTMFATHVALVCREDGRLEHGEPVSHDAFLPAASVQMVGVSTHTTIGPITADGITFWFVPEGEGRG